MSSGASIPNPPTRAQKKRWERRSALSFVLFPHVEAIFGWWGQVADLAMATKRPRGVARRTSLLLGSLPRSWKVSSLSSTTWVLYRRLRLAPDFQTSNWRAMLPIDGAKTCHESPTHPTPASRTGLKACPSTIARKLAPSWPGRPANPLSLHAKATFVSPIRTDRPINHLRKIGPRNPGNECGARIPLPLVWRRSDACRVWQHERARSDFNVDLPLPEFGRSKPIVDHRAGRVSDGLCVIEEQARCRALSLRRPCSGDEPRTTARVHQLPRRPFGRTQPPSRSEHGRQTVPQPVVTALFHCREHAEQLRTLLY
jgi:hypothetical protein